MTKKSSLNLLRFFVLLGVCLISLFSFRTEATEKFIFVGWENEPFYYQGPHGLQGAILDVMTEICRLENLRCTFKIKTFRDTLDILKKGNAQAGGPLVYTFPRASILNFSEEIFSSTYGFFAFPKNAKKITSYDSLRGLTIGVMPLSGSRVSLEAVNEFVDGKITVSDEKTISAIMQGLENKKYPVGYTNRHAALTWIAKKHSALVEISGLGENLNYRIALSKKGLSADMTAKILASFAALRKSGFMTSVAQKYNLTLAAPGKGL